MGFSPCLPFCKACEHENVDTSEAIEDDREILLDNRGGERRHDPGQAQHQREVESVLHDREYLLLFLDVTRSEVKNFKTK